VDQSQTVRQRLPVVLGAGLAGLAISRALAAAGIPHVLVGGRPPDTPRLGESLNAEGSVEIARQFPDLRRFLFEKRRQAVFFGEHTVTVDFARLTASPAYYGLLGYPPSAPLLHVDRVGFDQSLFDAVVATKYCVQMNGRLASLDVDAVRDRIDAVRLHDGTAIEAAYVFDATNFGSFVARQIGVRRRVLGDERRVVFAHYHAADSHAAAARWMDATLLLRLDPATDGVDGLAWCIPLGTYVSIGVSVDPARTSADPATLLERVEAAWSRRGIDVRASFNARSAPVDARYEHYRHERCYGRNWVLAGTSCCQFWFPSASGVAMALMAARLAPDIVRSPVVAATYQAYVDEVAASHAGLEWLAADDPAAVPLAQLRARAVAINEGNTRRFVNYVGLQPPPQELAFGDALLRLFETNRRLASAIRVDAAPIQALGTRLFSPAAAAGPWMDRPHHVPVFTPRTLQAPEAILKVLDVLSGRLGIDSSAAFVTPDVTLQIDQFELAGIESWTAWVEWLRAVSNASVADLVAVEAIEQDSAWLITAQWQVGTTDTRFVSSPLSIVFGMDGDRVASIRTRRADYTLVLGDSILPPPAFAAALGLRTAAVS
jgi:flavin-dependent dehydrogenase